MEERSMHIPWTPRTVWNPVTPEVQPDAPDTLCERTIAILHPIIWKALKPFPEARKAFASVLRVCGMMRYLPLAQPEAFRNGTAEIVRARTSPGGRSWYC